jgi:dipeptidyl aminopeptidase/acylaminoacyl peptidase
MVKSRYATFFSILFFTILLSAVASAQSVLPLERIFNKPYIAGSRPTSPNISPDGKFIIFRWDSTNNNKYRYWMMNSDGNDMHMIQDTLVGEIEWSPDSRTIACTKKGDIFLTDHHFKNFERLTKTDDREGGLSWSKDGSMLFFSSGDRTLALTIGKTGISEILKPAAKDWSSYMRDIMPNGKKVIFIESTREGLPEFITPRYTGKDVTTSSFRGGIGKTKIGLASVDTGKTIYVKLPGEERFFLGDVAPSPDSKSIFIERFSANRKERETFLADTDSGKAVQIYEEKDKAWVEGGLATTRWMPDGKSLITTSEKTGWNHLYRMSLPGKNMNQLTEGKWEITWFDIDPSGASIYFLSNKEEHAQWQLYSLDLKTKNIKRLTSREGTYESPSMSKDGTFILATYSNFAKPSELVRISTASAASMVDGTTNGIFARMDKERQLTASVPDEFTKTDWVKPEIVHFTSKDKKSIPAMIYKPNDFNPLKKYPVVVFVHGAGYLQNVFRGWSYYYREYMFHHRLTQKGYVVFEVEYRGSAGLGRDFRTDVYMHLGGKDLQDELDGLEYLKRLGYIDSARVGIYGGSYGGFMVLMGLMRSDAYACGAALRAVTSWENYYRHNPWYTEARLGKPEDNPKEYQKSSPITFADSLNKPLLILHGMMDDNVFFQDAVQLVNKLQKSGKKFELMVYPEEAHSFTEPEAWLDEYARIEEFFDRHLKKETK